MLVRATAPLSLLLLLLFSACTDDVVAEPAPLSLVAVTFNTGTTSSVVDGVAAADNGGYGPDEAAIEDAHYGDGIAFTPFVERTRDALATVAPDVIGFQEIFDSTLCPGVDEAARPGFVCETWQPGDPTVAQVLLGAGYQVACHLGKSDKCLGVKTSFATIRGCDGPLCLDFLDGVTVDGCGSGSRLGRATLDLVAGGTLSVINVHGTSGFADEDTACRERMFRAIFEATDDGGPLVTGERTIILGDWNTDPGRLFGSDQSADVVLDHVGRDQRFHFVTAIGSDAPPTYFVLNIDHVVSDAFDGDCVHPGSGDVPRVLEERFFDHKPAICTLVERAAD